MIVDAYDGVKEQKIKRSDLIKAEKSRLFDTISSTNKLTLLMACAGSADTLFRIGAINEDERQTYFTVIENKIKTIPVEDFRM